MTLSSTPGAGTRVDLWLPEARDTPEPASERPGERTGPIAARRRLTLLLVDDEDRVRASTATILANIGYDVIETASGEEALKILAGDDPIDAVLTDYLMPGMSGAELAAELAARRPSLPVLIVTGYAKAAIDIPAHVHRLGKPFLAEELERAIRKCLDDSKGPTAPVSQTELV